jgi:protease PrsW
MRVVLTIESGSLTGRQYALDGGSLTVGRDEGCQLRFDPLESQVSRHHALVHVEAEGASVADQSSTNGTRVNGCRVTSAPLHDGDLIELGAGGPRIRVAIARFESTRAAVSVPGRSAPADPRPPSESEARVSPASATTVPRPALRPVFVDRAFYDPTRDKGRRYGFGGVALVVGMLGLGSFLGLLVALLTAYELGLGIALVGVVVAFTPAPLYLTLWLWLDRYDPEPLLALAGCLVWGAGAATFVSSLFNSAFGAAMDSLTGNEGLAMFLSASLSAPFVEEATKGAAVLLVFLLLRREFDGILDGIAYAGVVALGFATVENVVYYGRVTTKQGAAGLLAVFVLRGVLGPFAHAVFTSMTGIGLGIARQSHLAAVRLFAPPIGYGGAVFLHFLWNTLAGLSVTPFGFLVIYIVVWIPLFLAFSAFVVFMGYRESRLIRRMLEPEVGAGLLTREQADTAASWLKRVFWLGSALPDTRQLAARRKFLHAAARLALSYWHVERAVAAASETLSVGQVPIFRKELARLQAEV